MKCVFVNGGAGFIGHHICMELKKNNCEVIAIDRMQQLKYHVEKKYYNFFINERINLLEQNNIKIISMDTANSKKYLELIKKYDPKLIYHMSAIASAKICQKDPSQAFSENLVKVEKLLGYIRVTNPEIRFVFASSSVAYGEFKEDSVTEETPLKPINFYGLTKKNSEEIIKLYNRSFGIPYTIIRPSALYGSRCINRRVSQVIIENALENKPITLFGGGIERLDFTFVDDTIQGFVKAGTSKNGLNQIFNITYGQSRAVIELVEILKEYFPNVKIKSEKRDKSMPKRGTLIVDKAKKLIGYEPIYPIEIGYPKYIEWYLSKKDDFLRRS